MKQRSYNLKNGNEKITQVLYSKEIELRYKKLKKDGIIKRKHVTDISNIAGGSSRIIYYLGSGIEVALVERKNSPVVLWVKNDKTIKKALPVLEELVGRN